MDKLKNQIDSKLLKFIDSKRLNIEIKLTVE